MNWLDQSTETETSGWIAAGGLSVNDFIIAARIDQIKTLDLIPKKRVWA
jgi:4a-hydroxytetrahydrobiopterin dehydratase